MKFHWTVRCNECREEFDAELETDVHRWKCCHRCRS